VGLRTTYPCARCLRQARCAWLLRDLRNAVAEARLRGMREDDVPDVVVDCVQQFVPVSAHRDSPPTSLAS